MSARRLSIPSRRSGCLFFPSVQQTAVIVSRIYVTRMWNERGLGPGPGPGPGPGTDTGDPGTGTGTVRDALEKPARTFAARRGAGKCATGD